MTCLSFNTRRLAASPRAAGTRVVASAPPSATRRRHPADDIELAARDLEQLARYMREPGPSHDDVHAFEETAQRIAAAIVGVFRQPAAPRAVHPPLRKVGEGYLF